MKINLRKLIGEVQPMYYSPFYRYGFLFFAFILILNWLYWLLTLPPNYPYERYGNGIVAGMLLFNHLAFAFKWKPSTGAILQVVAFVWLVLGFLYLIVGTRIFFPTH